MKQLRNRARWVELVTGLLAATGTAVALWAVGLPEVAWLPYVAVAAAPGGGSLARLRRGTGS